MKVPKGFSVKSRYKVQAKGSRTPHDSIVKTVSSEVEGPPLPPPTADEVRELFRRVDKIHQKMKDNPESVFRVPLSTNYTSIAQWREGPLSDDPEEFDSWQVWGSHANWNLKLLLLDKIEALRCQIRVLVNPNEQKILDNLQDPFENYWPAISALKKLLVKRGCYEPLKNGLEGLESLISAHFDVRKGEFEQSNIKTLHGMDKFNMFTVEMYQHEIILGKGKRSSNRDAAGGPRKKGLPEIFDKLKAMKNQGSKPLDLWPEFIAMLKHDKEHFDKVEEKKTNDHNPKSWEVSFLLLPDNAPTRDDKMTYERFRRRLNKK